jgi:hypothetical protein
MAAQAPPQPAKLKQRLPSAHAGVGVSVTTVPPVNLAVQVPGQLIPAGLLLTVPPFAGATPTDRLKIRLNVAVIDCAPLMIRVQVPVPVQAPLHPTNVEFLAAAADSVTLVPLLKLAMQVPGQFIPAGLLVTRPEPVTLTVSEEANKPNVAVTELAPFMIIVQLPVPVQAPLHPVKLEPAAGVAVSVTIVPLLKLAVQVPGQFIPAGLLLTVPPPTTVTESAKTWVNVAVTDSAALIVTVQIPVPVQAPLHPAKLQPEAGVAVSITEVPLSKVVEQTPGQVIPDGLLVTVPLPAIVTFNGKIRMNVAVTDSAWLIVTTQVPAPLQAPLHPTKREPEAGVAVSVTIVPTLRKFAEHAAGQLIPAGLLVTLPLPLPASATLNAGPWFRRTRMEFWRSSTAMSGAPLWSKSAIHACTKTLPAPAR